MAGRVALLLSSFPGALFLISSVNAAPYEHSRFHDLQSAHQEEQTCRIETS